MDKIIGALTQDNDDNRPNASSLGSGNKGPGGALGPLAGNILGLLDNDDDKQRAAEEASRRAGDSGNSDLFKTILGSLSSDKDKVAREDIDEEDAVKTHKKFFGNEGDNEQADSRSLGSAAAMQALKLFSSGNEPQKSSSESAFLALAMSEASKLFDQQASQGKVASGASKESAVQQAGEMALKMYLKSQVSGGSGASSGGSSGGAGDLMNLASKFLK
ncbi:hypothetical protein SAPIO_CDS1383 [Scedosporium apiospermum]|uniref:DUF7721 domain-containing protein n=1 Tax=Pseudallescheria apiosperma TaxID=563466 RepID=A0A084GF73_PSEDA|nr:uncharacterized protein SAPIO_CDS1383 [Scedosporium apiospermum]KEZ45985.1 hypothetical protein SAPIO_CDS1383 [Scedosporium apiospermum]